MERGTDDGEELALPIHVIAERFIDVYWQQVAPYRPDEPAPSEALGDSSNLPARPSHVLGPSLASTQPDNVLKQNTGDQAAVLTAIQEFREATKATTLGQARSKRCADAYDRLVKSVGKTVSDQPLQYLQNLGGTTDQFLYYRTRGRVHLQPGVAFCLRRFQPLIQDAARSAWVNHVRNIHANQRLLGSTNDLELFLFATTRESLLQVRERLIGLEGSRCFYCRSQRSQLDVDHFLPFALYPRDLIHNFVLADPACNRSKSDSLAAGPHLQRWSDRLSQLSRQLDAIGNDIGITADLPAHRSVARWAYTSARISGAAAWLTSRHYEPVKDADLMLLAG